MSREYRSIPADKVLARFSPERLARIRERAAELLADLDDPQPATGETRISAIRPESGAEIQ